MTTNCVDSDMKYRKKPVIIEASQWFKNGDHPLDYSCTHDGLENGKLRQFSPEERKDNNWEGDIVRYYRHPEVSGETACKHCNKTMHNHGWVDTLEGGHIVCPGDWIITGVEGEHYPCKPHIFEQTYESTEQQPAPDVSVLVEALEWYSEQVANCRKITSEGERSRAALDRDGGARARAALEDHYKGEDVLAEALESLIKGYVSLLEAGRDRITGLGGDCDPVDVMERDDAYLREARTTLVAHRKGDRP